MTEKDKLESQIARNEMLKTYFYDWDVRPEFNKEFVCIFDGWLGMENLHKLDEVTEVEWSRFNNLLQLLHQNYRLYIADLVSNACSEIEDIEPILMSYKESGDKEYNQFTKIIIPELNAVYTEEWDCTSIIWYKNKGVVEALSPLIKSAGLFHWNDADAEFIDS